MTDARRAAIFVVSVLLVGWSFETLIILAGGVRRLGPLSLVALMWTPGAVAIVLGRSLGSGDANEGLRFGPGSTRTP